jgi:Fic family protein
MNKKWPVIEQLHRDLLQFSTKDERHRGHYKTTTNHVGAFDEHGNQIAVIFETATPFDTPRLMTELVAWYNHKQVEKTIHPLIAIAVFIIVFLEIHPFKDGNELRSYYLSLRQTQGTIRTDAPAWQPWVLFFLRSLASQVIRLEEKVTHEKLVLAALPALSLLILDLAKKQGRITINDVVLASDANRNTIKTHLRKLTQSGQIKQQVAGRGVWYGLA